MSEHLLSVDDLRTYFATDRGVVRAVDGVSFDVRPGEVVGLVGESGAGKSVVARSLLRLVDDPGRIVGGEVRFRDRTLVGFDDAPPDWPARADSLPDREFSDATLPPARMGEEIRGSEIALVFQDPTESLNPVVSVGAQLREVLETNRDLDRAAAREAAVAMLRAVDIPEPAARYDDYPHQLSRGLCQRVLLAMAFGCDPSLIVADEPTTALDVTIEAGIMETVRDLQARYDTAFLWITHDLGVVADLCDRVAVMYCGEVVEQAPVDDLFHDTKHPYTRALLDAIPRPDRTVDRFDAISGTMPEAVDPPSGCRFHSRCPDARAVCTEVAPDCRVVADGEQPHRAACVKHDAFDADYEHSPPIDASDADDTDQGGPDDR